MDKLENNRTALPQMLAHQLQSLPHLRVVSVAGDAAGQPDVEVRIHVNGQTVRLIGEVKASVVYPRDVANLAEQLRRLAGPSKVATVKMVGATAISEGARQVLREAELGYWDAGGSLYLPLPGGLYFIDRPVPKVGERRLANMFQGSSAQVVHVLLEDLRQTWAIDRRKSWHVHRLGAEVRRLSAAPLSDSTVHQTLEKLEAEGWVEKEGRGPQAIRRVTQPGAILDAWARHMTARRETVRRFHVPARAGRSIEHQVLDVLQEFGGSLWALTGAAGAEHVAPFVTHVPVVTLRTGQNLPVSMLESAGFRAVDEGENLVVIPSEEMSPFLFRRRVPEDDRLWLVSDVQLYLDLWASPRRGKEQAQHLREVRFPY